jgi:hypothetical protein
MNHLGRRGDALCPAGSERGPRHVVTTGQTPCSIHRKRARCSTASMCRRMPGCATARRSDPCSIRSPASAQRSAWRLLMLSANAEPPALGAARARRAASAMRCRVHHNLEEYLVAYSRGRACGFSRPSIAGMPRNRREARISARTPCLLHHAPVLEFVELYLSSARASSRRSNSCSSVAAASNLVQLLLQQLNFTLLARLDEVISGHFLG